jgi:transcriptional regulator with XRE-family HTH domain
MDHETKRARAMWAYSGKEHAELAAELGIPKGTLQNYLGLSRSGPDLAMLIRMADACGVPRAFAEVGWLPTADMEDVDLRERVNELSVALTQLAAEVARRTTEQVEPAGTDRPPKPRRRAGR